MTAQTELPPAPARALRGHLRLVSRTRSLGETYLAQQSFRSPVHLSKPFLSAGTLIVQVANPNAGLLAGDEIDMAVTAEGQSRLLLTNPGATRLHCMKAGRARVEQRLTVAAGARLDFWPEIMIPQRGTRYDQFTRLQVDSGAELLFLETLTPGRVAHGEVFVFDQLRFHTELFHGATRIVQERYRLSPQDQSLYGWRKIFPCGYLISGFVVTPHLQADSNCWSQIRALHGDSMSIASSQLSAGVWAIRGLARDSLALKKSVQLLRRSIYDSAGWQLPDLRKS